MPMTAILLAAGVGRRMGPQTGPKCLLKVGGKTLLHRLLDGLRAAGVCEVGLVVGFGQEHVMAEARACSFGIRLHLFKNDRFREGAILSLWAARDLLDRPVLVMDTDLILPQAALERLVRSPQTDCILVDSSATDTGEEQMVFGEGDRVFYITKRPDARIRSQWTCFGEAVGILKLSSEGARLLRRCLEKRVAAGDVGIEHEQVYPDLFQLVRVGYERMDGLPWTEIDTQEDLQHARMNILPQLEHPSCLNRAMARWFLPIVLRLPITPNGWTTIGLLCGLGSAWAVAYGSYPMDLWAAFLFQMFYLIDNWDGEVARVRGLSTRWGGWYDAVVDWVVQVAWIVGMTWGLLNPKTSFWVLGLGIVGAVGLTLDFFVVFWAKARGFGPAVYGDPARGLPSKARLRWMRWLKEQWTQENFSWLITAVLLLGLKSWFLLAMALGSHLYWIRFLWQARHRLGYNLVHARR